MRNNICFVYLLLLIVLPVCSKNVSHFSIYEIMCEQQVEPLGIENKSPRFSWKVVSQQRAYRQSAYRILVTDIEGALAADEGTIWDSGKCFSSNSVLIPFQGRELHSATRYYWKVKVWNEAGEESVWSKQGSFVTGMMKERDWGKAQWIALEKDDPEKNLYPGIHAPLVGKMIGGRKVGGYKLPMFRKELLINKEVKEAIVNISGLGHFDFYVNGEKVGNHFLDPGWTNYAKTALYLTFDVTPLLKKENVLGVILGNGFYNVPRERYFKQLISFGAPKVKLVLSLKYTDGSSELVVTNRNWKVCESPITYSSIYGGEDYDARKYQSSWMNPGFNDDLWTAPVITKTEMELKVQTSAPLTVRDQLPVVRKYQNSKGNWIFDFGQNFSGIVRLKVRGYGGHKVTMKPGELLEKDSTVNQRASGGPYFWSYTLSGKGVEEWHPQFTYYGFRYVEVSGAEKLELIELAGMHTTNSAPEVGHFSCSLPMFNKIYELIDWSVRSNLASILTDCPHREKLGWLEVAHLMQYAMQYRYQLNGLYSKVMGEILRHRKVLCPPLLRSMYDLLMDLRILRNGGVHLLLYLGIFTSGMEIKVCYLLIIHI
ncbi:alpha-L-rhamnosidase [Bacteroides ovatus]|nr:family 78 glycoside hydrolase catalytic domain [Bacteroides ovatus]CAG9876778.1 alpha-L-rhamnosidase [Bacteroides ovatus]